MNSLTEFNDCAIFCICVYLVETVPEMNQKILKLFDLEFAIFVAYHVLASAENMLPVKYFRCVLFHIFKKKIFFKMFLPWMFRHEINC